MLSLRTDSVSGPRAPRALCLLPFGMVLSLQPRVASPHPRAEQYSALGTRSADFWGSVSPEIAPVLCPVLGMRALLVAMNLRSGSLVGAAWVPLPEPLPETFSRRSVSVTERVPFVVHLGHFCPSLSGI